jgi:hypothetical protein
MVSAIKTSQMHGNPPKMYIISNIIVLKRFLLDLAKKVVFDVKSWGLLKNVKIGSSSYKSVALSIQYISKNGIKI